VVWDLGPFPPEDPEDFRVAVGIDTSVCAAEESEKKDSALKFLEFLSKKENAQIFSDMDNSPSTIKGVFLNTTDYPLLVKALGNSEAILWPNSFWGPGMKQAHEVAVQQLVVSGDIEAFLDQTDRDFEDSLDGVEDLYSDQFRNK